MSADRAQANQGVELRYPNRFRRLCETLVPENLGKHCREWSAGKTETEIKLLIQSNSKPQDLTVCTLMSQSPKTSQGRVSLSGKVRVPKLPFMKTVQPIRSQLPAWQWRWKQSAMTSAGLPQDVTIWPHIPSFWQIQWACYKSEKWNGKPRLECVNGRHPPSKNSVGVLPWTCWGEGKWPSR